MARCCNENLLGLKTLPAPAVSRVFVVRSKPCSVFFHRPVLSIQGWPLLGIHNTCLPRLRSAGREPGGSLPENTAMPSASSRPSTSQPQQDQNSDAESEQSSTGSTAPSPESEPSPSADSSTSTSSSPSPQHGTSTQRSQPHRHQRAQRGPLNWLFGLLSQPQAQLPLRIAFNVAVLLVLMKLWPAGRSGDDSDETIIKLPYSDFVRCAKTNQVELVSVNGLRVVFTLRPDSALLAQRRQQLQPQAPQQSLQSAADATPSNSQQAAAAAAAAAAMGAASAAPSTPPHAPTHTAASLSERRASGRTASTSAPTSATRQLTEQTTSPQAATTSTSPQQQPSSPDIYFYTLRPSDYPMPYEFLETNDVRVSAIEHRENRLLPLLGYVVLLVLLGSTISRLMNRQDGGRNPGRKHRPHAFSGPGGGGAGGGEGAPFGTTFADVAGVDEAKEELQEIVEYLRAPERFSRLGARPPAGVLLVGPPGTGKTLLAKAVAGEAGVPFFSISASEFVELYVGMGAMRVRELFAAARREAPAIVFIDEIDAVAKGRDMRLRSMGNDEREQTLNQLLTELDGFDSGPDKTGPNTQSQNSNNPAAGLMGLLRGGAGSGGGGMPPHPASGVVICLAATNRPDVLDPALLRPGRFDRRVAVERPDKIGREQILRVHLGRRGLPLAPDVCVSELAAGTTGFTGADLANLVNEAALLGGRRGKAAVGREEFDAAVMRAVAGIEKKRSILRGTEKAVVARHEVGHAVVGAAVARLLEGFGEPSRLSIIPRTGGALGFTYTPPKSEDRALMFDSEVRGQLAVLLGGRAAEHLTCAAVSTGAADDIRRATDLATRAVAELGLSAAVGPLHVGVLAAGGGGDEGGLGLGVRESGGEMAALVEREVRSLVDGALAVAMDVLSANAATHTALSEQLEREERLEGPTLAGQLAELVLPPSLEAFLVEGRVPERRMGLRQRGVGPTTVAAAAAGG